MIHDILLYGGSSVIAFMFLGIIFALEGLLK